MEREFSYFELSNICNLYELWAEGKIDTDTMSSNLLNAYIRFDGILDIPPVWDMFLKCNKELLMDEEEIEGYRSLPNKVKLYRGQATELLNGISWTTDIEVARKFANFCRYDEVGILEVEVDKADIICYTNGRNEQECICFATDEAEWVETWSKSKV